MSFLERALAEIGEFFARDILSFAILIFISAFLLNHLASAQTIRKTSSISQKMRTKKYADEYTNYLSSDLKFHNSSAQRKSWQINLGLNTIQKKQSSLGLHSETAIKLGDESSFKGFLSYTQYSQNTLQNDVSDLLMNFYFMKSKWPSNLTLSPYLTSTIPLSKDSTQRQFLNFGVGLGAKLSSQSRLGSGVLSTAGSISVQKYFHKYEVAINNYSNVSYLSNQQITTGWDYKQFGLSVQLRHINSWNYTGAVKDSFFHMQTLSWNVNNQFSVTAGQTSYGAMILPNQEEIENRFIEDNSAAFFVSTNYVF